MKTARILLAAIVALGAGSAYAGLIASEPAETATAEAKPEATAETAARSDDEELKLPPGFRKVQRGKYTLYCKKDTPIGTRFKTEKCLDEDGMRNYILELAETKGDVDRMRSTCSNVCVCGGDC
jgi:hypothetical protein